MTHADLDRLEAQQRARRFVMIGVLVIVALTVLAYSRVATFDFIWDDESYVTRNRFLQTIGGLGQMWIPLRTPQYYPVVFTTFWIEHQLWGLNPAGFHVVNVVLHALGALLLWAVCRKIGLPGAASWLIAAIFAVHPVNVESVAWITERKNVLSGVFYLAAAWSYLQFESIRAGEIEDKSPTESWGWYGAALVLFILALLSKSVTCSLPAALVLVFLYQRRSLNIARLAPLVPLFVLGLLAALNTARIEVDHVGATGAAFDLSVAQRLIIASRALLFYPLKIVWPHPLIFNYTRWTIDPADVLAWWPVAVVALVAALVIWLYATGRRGPFIALAFYAGTIFPALGFFSVYPHQFSFVADHFQYLASIGVIALIVMLGAALLPDPRRLLAVGVVPLLIFTVLAWRHSADFSDLETLWRTTLAKNPDAWMPHNNLSSILLRQAAARLEAGESADDLITEAERHARRAVEINPAQHTAHANLAEALRLEGRIDDALEQAAIATRERPSWPDHHRTQGRLFELANRPDDAIEAYRETIRLAPDDIPARLDLARVLLSKQRLDDAAAEYENILQRDPDQFTAIGTLANIRARQGRFGEAESLFDRALRAARRPQDQIQIAMREAIFLIQCPDAEVHNPDKSIFIAEQVVNATKGSLPNTLDVLALAYAAAGRFDDAVATAQQAAALARRVGVEALAEEIESRLAYYQRSELPPLAQAPESTPASPSNSTPDH